MAAAQPAGRRRLPRRRGRAAPALRRHHRLPVRRRADAGRDRALARRHREPGARRHGGPVDRRRARARESPSALSRCPASARTGAAGRALGARGGTAPRRLRRHGPPRRADAGRRGRVGGAAAGAAAERESGRCRTSARGSACQMISSGPAARRWLGTFSAWKARWGSRHECGTAVVGRQAEGAGSSSGGRPHRRAGARGDGGDRPQPARHQPRRPGQGDGPPAGAAPAVAGRDERADQRRRGRPDRRGRPLQAGAGRALRRLRPPPRAGRDARRAARARLGAALAAPHAPRPRRRRSPSCATSSKREPTEDEVAGELSMSPAEYDKSLDQIRTLDLGAIRQLDATGEDGSPLFELCLDPDEGPDAQLHRTELRDAARRRDPPAARARARDPGALLRGRADDGRDRQGHRRLRIARLAAALAGPVAPARDQLRDVARGPAGDEHDPFPGGDRRAPERRRPTRAASAAVSRPDRQSVGRRLQLPPAGSRHRRTRSARCTSCTTASRATSRPRCRPICGSSPTSPSCRWSSSPTPSS